MMTQDLDLKLELDEDYVLDVFDIKGYYCEVSSDLPEINPEGLWVRICVDEKCKKAVDEFALTKEQLDKIDLEDYLRKYLRDY